MQKENWQNIDYLREGTLSQQRAWKILTQTQILEHLADFDPVVIGTIPIDIDVEGSDIDIACFVRGTLVFKQLLESLYPAVNCAIYDQKIVAKLVIDSMDIEIYGENIPVERQNGYIHMVNEAKLLKIHGDELRENVRKLKRAGMKTEPAFASCLQLAGDPYVALAQIKI
ncbi:MAG: DUF4269 domain-containing protein [Simkaniaceae bacterium]|nr:DUF4269 domain-containing protein [Simkaniaceae bacterium]